MTGLLIKRGNLETDMHIGRTPCEDKGRGWGDASTSQGKPTTAGKPPAAGQEAWSRFSLMVLIGSSLANALSLISSQQSCETINF